MDLGGVKRDVFKQEREFKGLSLSDVNVVRLLMEYRYKYDMYTGFEADATFDVAGSISPVNNEVIATFASLDELIEQCKFNDTQLKIIKLTEDGYTLKEIATLIGLSNTDNIKKRMNKICKDIVKMNLWNWRKVIYTNDLGLKSKTCSKCKEDLPAVEEFFSPSNQNSDGFFNYCKVCR